MKILVTGATGFVGTALIDRIVSDDRFSVRAAVRRPDATLSPRVERVTTDMAADVDWRQALADITLVVHLAARVHVMRDGAANPLAEFRRLNVDSTCTLARQAAEAGVRRFVYLSSVKVNGESGMYSEADPPAPQDAYGISKHEAELGLRHIASATAMEVVIIRPPLVYGPQVRANFNALMKAVALGIPLPLGAIDNRRSLVALDNLVDFILTCLVHVKAANETFFVSDGDDLSTTDLIRRLARAMDRPVRLIPVPAAILLGAATLLGRRDVAQRLLGSLCVDITKARQRLGWVPPISMDEGLRRAVAQA